MCFFLGNDFMPHFPAVNIRTGGITKLLDAYKATIGATHGKVLTDGTNIYWPHVKEFVSFLAIREESFLKAEMKLRDRRSKYARAPSESDTVKEKLQTLDNLPSYERSVEKFINPFNHGWKDRYYKALFNGATSEKSRYDVCTNYLEGLEWTTMYYNTSCSHWRWKYNYHYPPLLSDLVKVIPSGNERLLPATIDQPVGMLVQLCYVLPHNSLHFLPEYLLTEILSLRRGFYPVSADFLWSFCKYFWEAHVALPEVNVEDLIKLVETCDINREGKSLLR